MKTTLFLVLFQVGLLVAQEVTVDVPVLGTIKGKTKMTSGNLGASKKPFYNFRNIPFAETVSGDKRYTQPVALRRQIGTPSAPYDATKNGPVCPQLGLSENRLQTLNNRIVDDWVNETLINNDLDDRIEVATVVMLMEDLMQITLTGRTIGDVFLELLDVELHVAEDCLNLAVSTPRLPSKEKQGDLLPVMFFIYGGGFFAGTQWRMGYERLGEVNDVVLVAVNYRLGTLGFMCLDTDESAGNMGLLDQITGLEWVRDNIEYFGGDPNNVMIFGESAGAASVSLLTLSSEAEGLFNKAIGESGSALATWAYDEVKNEYHARKIAEKVDCDLPNLDDMVSCLRQVDFTTLNQAEGEWAHEEEVAGEGLGFGGHSPCPQTKGARKVFSAGETPTNILETGNYNKIPMMFGTNFDEGLLPFGVADTTVVNETLKHDKNWLQNEMVHFFLQICGYDSVSNAEADAFRDDYYTPQQIDSGDWDTMAPGSIDGTGALLLKEPVRRKIAYNSQYIPSYLYVLGGRGQKSFYRIFNEIGNEDLYEHPFPDGYSAHADDLMFLFDVPLPFVLCNLGEVFTHLTEEWLRCLPENGFDPILAEKCVTAEDSPFRQQYGECIDGHLTAGEEQISNAMVQAWTDFAITGNPTPPGSPLPTLPPYTPFTESYIIFDFEITVVQGTSYNVTYHYTPQ